MKTIDENFVYGYDNKIYNLRSTSRSTFNCYYARANKIPNSFKDECVRVCEKISDYAVSQNKIPFILLSGGLDSEIVVRSFFESGRDFQIITNRFSKNLNDHEIEHVEFLCNELNLKPIYIDIDIESWLISNDAYNFARISKCIYSEMLPTMKLMHDVYFNLGGIPVLGNGDLYVSKEINNDWRVGVSDQKYEWMYIEYEYIVAWLRYAVNTGVKGGINFFQHTPEIVLSMALDPLIQNLVKTNPVGKQSSRSTKYLVYKKYWPESAMRRKFHGAEKISDLCNYLNKDILIKNFYDYSSRWTKSFDSFVNEMMPYGN